MVILSILAAVASLFLLSPLSYAQSGFSTDIGQSTLYSFDKFSESRQSINNTDFYNFSDGSNTTGSRIGSTETYSSLTPSLSGSIHSPAELTALTARRSIQCI